MKPACVLVLCAAVAVIAAVAGCGGKGAAAENRVPGDTLTIYTSVPLHGASRAGGQEVISGAELALAQIRARIGRYRIVLKTLDDSSAQRGVWDPGQTTVNARIATQNPTTIGYIGELNSGASAVSVPLLNRVGIAQVSPTSTAVGLTSDAPGSSPGEPDKYYPTGARTFARVVPSDAFQAAAQVQLQESLGCKKAFVVDDGEVDGEDMATSFELAAKRSNMQLVGLQMFDPTATNYTSLAASIARTGANCVLISAISDSNVALLTKQIAAAIPQGLIFGTGGVAESSFSDPAQGGIPSTIDPRVLITVGAVDPSPPPSARHGFFAAYERRYGPAAPYAILGYEAMSLMLNAISRATGGGTRPALRSKVVAAMLDTRGRRSVLGTYSINHDGDTTLRRYGVYRVVDGQLEFWKAISPRTTN
jgi:branched-chain amino acid transport system substrate-binding protein